MLKNNIVAESHHEELIDQVTTPLIEEKKLQKAQESLTKIFEKSLGELFERCFISNALEAEEYQRLTELAAKLGVSTEQIKVVESLLKEEVQYISGLQIELNKSIPSLRGKNNRKEKKRIKRHLVILSNINIALRRIVEQCWWYLSPKQKEYLEGLTASLATIAPERQARIILRRWEHFGFMPPVTKVHLDFYMTTARLIESVVNADDDDADLFSTDLYLANEFLDLLNDDIENHSSELVPYTEEMDLKLNELLEGTEID